MKKKNNENTVKVNICNLDTDCKQNEFCAFDEKNMKHYCKSNKNNELYVGCLNTNKYNELNSIESRNEDDVVNIKSCVNFVRKQVNNDNYSYDYMVYKNKINSFVDVNTVNIYLKCGKEVLMVLPPDNFFDVKCINDQKECILKPNDAFKTFVRANNKSCGGKLSLDVEYECDNEKLKNNLNIPFTVNNIDNIQIKLLCPIDLKNEKFQSKCVAAYFDNQNSNPDINDYKELLDKKVKPEDCVLPVYKVPRIVNDLKVYQQVMNKKKEEKIKKFNEELKRKSYEINKLKAEKFMALFEKETGKKISFDDAMTIISNEQNNDTSIDNNENFQSLGDDSEMKQCYWKIYNNFYLFPKVNLKELNNHATFIGEYKMIEEVRRKACDLKASCFIWFSNKYPVTDIRNRMYIMTKPELNRFYEKYNHLKDINNLIPTEDVHIGIISNYLDTVYEQYTEQVNTYSNSIDDLFNKFYTFIDQNMMHTDQNINSNDQTINKLNKEISTLTQKIKMNQYEQDVNNNIVYVLGILAVVFFIIIVVTYIYKKTNL